MANWPLDWAQAQVSPAMDGWGCGELFQTLQTARADLRISALRRAIGRPEAVAKISVQYECIRKTPQGARPASPAKHPARFAALRVKRLPSAFIAWPSAATYSKKHHVNSLDLNRRPQNTRVVVAMSGGVDRR